MKELIFSFLLLSLASCGGDDQGEPYVQDTFEISSDEEFKSIVDRATLSYDAPSGVGLLIKRESNSGLDTLGTCTWFKVASDIMATNSHCIPDIIKEDKENYYNCANFIAGVVGEEAVYCKELISYTDISKSDFTQVDLAFVRVNKEVNTREFTISREGFSDLGEVLVHKIDTQVLGEESDSPRLNGMYNPKTCKASMGSILGNFHDKRSTIVPIYETNTYNPSGDCKIIGGNSGSPVSRIGDTIYDASAIAFAGKANSANEVKHTSEINILDIIDRAKVATKIELDINKEINNIGYFGLISNFSCLTFPTEISVEQSSADCSSFLESENTLQEKFFKDLITQANQEINKEIEDYQIGLPADFQYEIKSTTNLNKKSFLIYALPQCYNPTLRDDDYYINYLEINSTLFTLDENAKIIPKTTKSNLYYYQKAKIELSDLWSSEEYRVRYRINNSGSNNYVYKYYEIVPCQVIP